MDPFSSVDPFLLRFDLSSLTARRKFLNERKKRPEGGFLPAPWKRSLEVGTDGLEGLTISVFHDAMAITQNLWRRSLFSRSVLSSLRSRMPTRMPRGSRWGYGCRKTSCKLIRSKCELQSEPEESTTGALEREATGYSSLWQHGMQSLLGKKCLKSIYIFTT